MRVVRLIPSILMAALVVAGCSERGYPKPMTIVNTTERAAIVTVVGQADTFDQLPLTVPAGGTGLLVDVFMIDGGCMRGTLVASQDGVEIGRNDQPCPGDRWAIGPAS